MFLRIWAINYQLLQHNLTKLEVKKSLFIGHFLPSRSVEEHRQWNKTLRAEHPKACHICTAFRITPQQMGSNDDGEPHGTAGRPMLDLLNRGNFVGCSIFVVRYFGGTLLGTGGLVKAYSTVAQQLIKTAKIEEQVERYEATISISYKQYNEIKYLFSSYSISFLPIFNSQVKLTYQVPLSIKEEIDKSLASILSSGS